MRDYDCIDRVAVKRLQSAVIAQAIHDYKETKDDAVKAEVIKFFDNPFFEWLYNPFSNMTFKEIKGVLLNGK